MADNETTGTGKTVATDKVTYSGDAYQNVQLVRFVQVTGSEGSKTVVALPGDATNGLLVNLGANNDVVLGGDVAHDTADSGNPVKIGAKAIAHGTNPTAVAAADRPDLYANRAGVLFTIGGHPNVVTLKHTTITTAVTDAAIITVSAGTKI